MTKKHFVAIAAKYNSEMRNGSLDASARVALIRMANIQADLFKSFNPDFNRDGFLAACGVA